MNIGHPSNSDSDITVRAYAHSDDEARAEILGLPGVRRGTLALPFESAERLPKRDEALAERSVNLCACIDARVVGVLDLVVQKPRRSHCASMAIAVHDAYVGRHVGTTLVCAALDCADRLLGLRRIELVVFADNEHAIALYRKFGFVEEGRSRAYAVRDGVLADALHMARLIGAPAFAAQ